MYLILARVHRPTTDPQKRVPDPHWSILHAEVNVDAARARRRALLSQPIGSPNRYTDVKIIEAPEVYDP